MDNNFPEPCHACSDHAPTDNGCSECGDACCKEHSVNVEGIVFCVICHEESQNEQEEE